MRFNRNIGEFTFCWRCRSDSRLLSSSTMFLTPGCFALSGSCFRQASQLGEIFLKLYCIILSNILYITCFFSSEIFTDLIHFFRLGRPHCPFTLQDLRVSGQTELLVAGDPQPVADVLHQLLHRPPLVHVERLHGVVRSVQPQQPHLGEEFHRVLNKTLLQYGANEGCLVFVAGT